MHCAPFGMLLVPGPEEGWYLVVVVVVVVVRVFGSRLQQQQQQQPNNDAHARQIKQSNANFVAAAELESLIMV